MRRSIAGLALAVSCVAHAQESAPGPLQRGTTVRVWSAVHDYIARRGWIEQRTPDSIAVRFPIDSEAAGSSAWETVMIARSDVDTIDVQMRGRWWRADFTDAAPQFLARQEVPGP